MNIVVQAKQTPQSIKQPAVYSVEVLASSAAQGPATSKMDIDTDESASLILHSNVSMKEYVLLRYY